VHYLDDYFDEIGFRETVWRHPQASIPKERTLRFIAQTAALTPQLLQAASDFQRAQPLPMRTYETRSCCGAYELYLIPCFEMEPARVDELFAAARACATKAGLPPDAVANCVGMPRLSQPLPCAQGAASLPSQGASLPSQRQRHDAASASAVSQASGRLRLAWGNDTNDEDARWHVVGATKEAHIRRQDTWQKATLYTKRCDWREFCLKKTCKFAHTAEERALFASPSGEANAGFRVLKAKMCTRFCPPGRWARCNYRHDGEPSLCRRCLGLDCRTPGHCSGSDDRPIISAERRAHLRALGYLK
jgi:hypothetical protein